jgi:hypothetical protein
MFFKGPPIGNAQFVVPSAVLGRLSLGKMANWGESFFIPCVRSRLTGGGRIGWETRWLERSNV